MPASLRRALNKILLEFLLLVMLLLAIPLAAIEKLYPSPGWSNGPPFVTGSIVLDMVMLAFVWLLPTVLVARARIRSATVPADEPDATRFPENAVYVALVIAATALILGVGHLFMVAALAQFR
jgi:hypothetical protein